MTKDFDTQVSTGQKVYLSVGADKGVKVGDYFRAVRSYDTAKIDPVDALAYKMPPSEDTQKNQVRVTTAKYATLPIRALGEMIIIGVTPTSATAMITMSKEAITVGDEVQLEGGPQQ